MPDFLDIHALARSLEAALADAGIPLTHAQALDAVARQHGLAGGNAPLPAVEPAACRFERTSPVFRMFDEALSKAFYLDFLGF
jgi:hypothetical protein